MRAGLPLNDLKRSFLPRFGITARQFNAIRVALEGKIASIRERRPGLIEEAEARIRKARAAIAKLERERPGSEKLHQKKRGLRAMESRLATLKADHEAGRTRLCFGSRKLFRAQFDLEANGDADRDEWKREWRQARSDPFFVLASGMRRRATSRARLALPRTARSV